MIRLPAATLPASAQSQLNQWQQQIDARPNYDDRVAAAKTQFSQRNKRGNATFDAVKETLVEMCSGAQRCGYCEDSAADEVEHIKPKDLYPEAAFVWENYLYACGPCNGPKNNRFAVFASNGPNAINVTRHSDAPIIPPLAGDPVLIDPRREDPLNFIELDLLGTFWFLPVQGLSRKHQQKAEYTIEILRLNERDLLPTARAEAYGSYRARLIEYVKKRDEGIAPTHLNRLVRALRGMGHPTVWKEMQRQQALLPELSRLFSEAPEALIW